MLLNNNEQSMAYYYLTENELKRLHWRFGHSSVQQLYKVLQRSGNKVEIKALEHLTKYCHQCQLHAKSPGRFKFVLKDDYDFNYEIIIDIIYLNNKLVLHIVNTITVF